MIGVSVHMTGDCWDDLAEKRIRGAEEFGFALLDKSEVSLKPADLPAIAVRMDLDDGSVAIGQMSARTFVSVARLFLTKCPELFTVA